MDLNDEQKKDAVSDGVPAEPVSPQTAQAGQSPAPGEAAEVKQKKENMPKSTTPAKPTECAACGKHLKKNCGITVMGHTFVIAVASIARWKKTRKKLKRLPNLELLSCDEFVR